MPKLYYFPGSCGGANFVAASIAGDSIINGINIDTVVAPCCCTKLTPSQQRKKPLLEPTEPTITRTLISKKKMTTRKKKTQETSKMIEFLS